MLNGRPQPTRRIRRVRRALLVVFALAPLTACRNRTADPIPPEPKPPARANVPDQPEPEVDAVIAKTPSRDDSAPLVVDFLNAGQGDCIHIACPNGNSIVVDCGSSGQADPELEDILAGLVSSANEVRVVVTHADSDHYNKLEKSLEDVQVLDLYVGGRASYFDGKKAEGWFRAHKAQYPAQPFDGAALGCGDDVKIDVLSASLDAPSQSPTGPQKNNASIVLRLERSGFGILLAGDAYEQAEAWMTQAHGVALESEVLKLGHHGSATSTSSKWVKAVKPEHVVITTGMHGSHKHPRCSVLENLEAATLEATKTLQTIRCYDAGVWTERKAKRSAWSTCQSGHMRLTVPAEGNPTLEPHAFPQDKIGDGSGQKCPARFQ